jgi:hypothetical protein
VLFQLFRSFQDDKQSIEIVSLVKALAVEETTNTLAPVAAITPQQSAGKLEFWCWERNGGRSMSGKREIAPKYK